MGSEGEPEEMLIGAGEGRMQIMEGEVFNEGKDVLGGVGVLSEVSKEGKASEKVSTSTLGIWVWSAAAGDCMTEDDARGVPGSVTIEGVGELGIVDTEGVGELGSVVMVKWVGELGLLLLLLLLVRGSGVN